MLVTPAEAKALGAKRYFTGKPCKHGHVADRWVSSGICVVCQKASIKRWKKANPDKVRSDRRAYRDRNRVQYSERRLARIHRKKGLPAPSHPRPTHCELCGRPAGPRRLALDHCHETGVFRGWLCLQCNTSLGKLGDTLAGVQRVMAYLLRSAGVPIPQSS